MRRSPDAAKRLALEVAAAGRSDGAVRTLVLDLDGTLAPIVERPEDARVPRPVLAALGRVVEGGWRIAVVSGRPVAEVAERVPVTGVRLFGSHGMEEAGREGRAPAVPPDVLGRLRALAVAGRALARRGFGGRVEVKPFGIAFHDRGLARTAARAWGASVVRLLDGADLEGLECLAGNRVVEVRVADAHKGRVADAMVPDLAGRRLDPSLVAVGDDRTDEDIFHAFLGHGLTVKVGPPHCPTLAIRRLPSPRAVGSFLERLAKSVDLDRGLPRRSADPVRRAG